MRFGSAEPSCQRQNVMITHCIVVRFLYHPWLVGWDAGSDKPERIPGAKMARRDSNPLYVLSLMPWKVSVIVAVTVFVLMRFVAPTFSAADNMLLHGLLNQTVPRLAPFFFCLFLLPAVLSFFRQRSRGRLLDKQTDIDSVRQLDWRQFEQLTAAALAREGYAVIEAPSRGE